MCACYQGCSVTCGCSCHRLRHRLRPSFTDVTVTVRMGKPQEVVNALRDAAENNGVPMLADIADQIAAQTKPPKPVEPQGLGAVVEDAEGMKWIRVYEDMWVEHDNHRHWELFDDINVVRVLSAGVTA